MGSVPAKTNSVLNGKKSNESPRSSDIKSKLKPRQHVIDNRPENFEPFTLICLDEHFYDKNEELRSIIDYVRCFTDFEQCEQFIKSHHNNDHLFFIVSSQYATNIVSHTHDLAQVASIYIMKSNANHNRTVIDDKWIKRYSKIRGIYDDHENLLDKLSSDVKTYSNIVDLISITVYSRHDALRATNSSCDHYHFVFYQLFVDEFCFNTSSLTKASFIEKTKDYYHSNDFVLTQIENFHNQYNSNSTLKWFLKETFLQNLLTKSLKILNIEMLFALRFFIQDMYKTMNKRDLSLKVARIENSPIYYRCQILSEETFRRIKLNIGELLSMNNFFFAHENRADTLNLIHKYILPKKHIYCVLFEIKVPSNFTGQKQRPFIDIKHFNIEYYAILFSIGTIFRINTVEFDISNECWTIKLTVHDQNSNDDFSQLFNYINNNKNPLTLANILRKICPHSAEQFYKYLLDNKSETLSKVECYHGLGLCSYSLENYSTALNYFKKALTMKTNNESIKSSLHNSIGLVYAKEDDIDQAYQHFKRALETSPSPLHQACIHHNLALIYGQQSLFDDELDHYQKALGIRTKELPSNHLQLATLFNNIGICHSERHEYDKALLNLRKALEIRLKLLSETHIDVAKNYVNIGTVYAKTKEYQMALEYFNKAKFLFEQQEGIPEESRKQLEENIKIVTDIIF